MPTAATNAIGFVHFRNFSCSNIIIFPNSKIHCNIAFEYLFLLMIICVCNCNQFSKQKKKREKEEEAKSYSIQWHNCIPCWPIWILLKKKTIKTQIEIKREPRFWLMLIIYGYFCVFVVHVDALSLYDVTRIP